MNAVFPVNYLFIDGGYLDAFLEKSGKDWFGETPELDYKKLSEAYPAKRVFYFDCLPAKKPSDSGDSYDAKRLKKEQLFEKLRSLNGWHVSEGLAQWRKKEGAGQKEIDIQIAVEMLTHVHRRNMDAVMFIAGDLDFRPLIEAVVRDGMYFRLVHGGSINPALRAAPDETIGIGPLELYDLCTKSYQRRIGSVTRNIKNGAPSGSFIEVGNRDGGPTIAEVRNPDPSDESFKVSYLLNEHDARCVIYRGRVLEQVKNVAAFYDGPVTWKSL